MPKEKGPPTSSFWAAASLGVTMVACTAVGLAIGLLLDKILKTGTVLTIIFFALGIAAGVREVIRQLGRMER